MSASTGRIDAMLMEILEEKKTITAFLDTIFGFLRRKTDFYHIKKNDSDKIGFPKGVRDQLLYGSVQRYDPVNYIDIKAPAEFSDEFADDVPPLGSEVIVVDSSADDNEKTTMDETVITSSVTNNNAATTPVTFYKPKSLFSMNDFKNGAVFDNYGWSQTLTELELHVALPKDLQTAKLLIIDLKPDSIKICSRANPNNVIVAGKLWSKLKYKDAVWTIDKGKMTINFDKTREQWWDKLFVHEPTIDLKNLDCERYIDELPEDSQAQIQKLRIEQMQQDVEQFDLRRTGENKEKLEKLRKAWDADGSPFQGQPFDPSMVHFT